MKQLLVSIIGPDKAGAINALCQLIAKSNCNIIESRINALGQEFAADFLVTGTWNAIAKLETSLPVLCEKYEMQSLLKRTDTKQYPNPLLPYSIYIVTLDKPGIIAKITQFFSDEGIAIMEIHSTTHNAKNTGTQMLTLNITIQIPADVPIADLRERFMLFCDDLNLDATIEPERN